MIGQQKTPVRLATGGLQLRLLRFAQFERAPVIDGRQAARALAGALPVEHFELFQPAAWGRGLLLGVGVALLASLPPLAAARRVPPIRVLRRDAEPLPPSRATLAGVALATSPIARFIAESLKPLRDFFLIMFFFSLGASFELPVLAQVVWPAAVLALLMLAFKPVVFKALLVYSGEAPKLSWEIGFRLGQISEFSFLIAVLAARSGVIGDRTSYLIQAATLITFIVSPYIVMLRFPTPIAVSAKLRRD